MWVAVFLLTFPIVALGIGLYSLGVMATNKYNERD